MAREFKRTDRLGDQLQRELAQLLEFEIQDPRLRSITVTEVRVARDLAHAKVYVTLLGPEEDRADVLQVLRHAAGFLRRQLAQRLVVRTTPALHFVYDESVDRGRRLSDLIDTAIDADRAMAQADQGEPSAAPGGGESELGGQPPSPESRS